jgi:hypothetical protein
MSKFMKPEERDQQIKDLMITIRRNTQGSKCIEIFESLLNEVEDKEFVDTVITDTHNFITEFMRLCKDVDNMKNLDYISRILTHEFILPQKYFRKSHSLAKVYLLMYDRLTNIYSHPVYDVEKGIILSNVNFLGDIHHKVDEDFTANDIVAIYKYFGDLSGLSVKEVKAKKELARMVILLYNYLPAIVKALIQTKRRSLNLDKNSKKFE